MRSAGIRILMMLAVYFLMSWWNILGWTTQVLSESLSMSFLFLWLASFLWLSKRREKWILALHILITLLFCFTRDPWIYILLCFYLMVLDPGFSLRKVILKYSLLMFITGDLGLCSPGRVIACGATHTRLPLANSMVLRVMPDSEYYAWFRVRGMPQERNVRNNLSHLDISKEDKLVDFFSLYSDPAYRGFLDWCGGQGRICIWPFWLTHPSYAFLLREPPSKLQRIWP